MTGRSRAGWPRGRAALTAAATAALVSGCGLIGGTTASVSDVPLRMTVTSQSFSLTEPMPARFTCHGAGLSPSIHWSGAPAGTKSLALIVDDSSAPITPFIYWIVFDIGSQTSATLVGQVPTGAKQADNSKGTPRYDPPCPVNGDHAYRFTVYALSRSLPLRNGVSLKTAWTAIAQAAIARGELTATAKS
jgi:Raf kinase inhibitor-like YbhB/YbcL family protein